MAISKRQQQYWGGRMLRVTMQVTTILPLKDNLFPETDKYYCRWDWNAPTGRFALDPAKPREWAIAALNDAVASGFNVERIFITGHWDGINYDEIYVPKNGRLGDSIPGCPELPT